MAAASVFVMQLPQSTYQAHTTPMQSHINVGFGSDISIAELARAIGHTVGYTGRIDFDASRPDGAPRKWMDSSQLNAFGWHPRVALSEGLQFAYNAMREEVTL
jgi:GDP-L-fucose synthase